MVEQTIDALSWLRKQLEDERPDLLRGMVASFAEQLMSAYAAAICGAAYGSPRPSASMPATGIAAGSGTPGWARSNWRFPICGRAATSPIGFDAAAAG